MNSRKLNADTFNSDRNCCAFILSMRIGAVGLNLTCAANIFIMDPCLNPATEAQSIGRSLRMGQDRQVEVFFLMLEGSIEANILQAVDFKRRHNDKEPATAPNSLDESGVSSSKRRRKGRAQDEGENQVGSNTTESQAMRLNELKMLFGCGHEEPLSYEYEKESIVVSEL